MNKLFSQRHDYFFMGRAKCVFKTVAALYFKERFKAFPAPSFLPIFLILKSRKRQFFGSRFIHFISYNTGYFLYYAEPQRQEIVNTRDFLCNKTGAGKKPRVYRSFIRRIISQRFPKKPRLQ